MFSVVFWKIDDFINTFWHYLTFSSSNSYSDMWLKIYPSQLLFRSEVRSEFWLEFLTQWATWQLLRTMTSLSGLSNSYSDMWLKIYVSQLLFRSEFWSEFWLEFLEYWATWQLLRIMTSLSGSSNSYSKWLKIHDPEYFFFLIMRDLEPDFFAYLN